MAGPASLIGRALSAAPTVFLGQISYSLYLWHWPVLVFARYYLVRELQPMEIGLALILMLVLAYLSWRFVEAPFRARNMPYRRVVISVLSGAAIACAAGLVGITTQGLPSRLPGDAATINAAVGTNYRCPITSMMSFGGSRACSLNPKPSRLDDTTFVLFGNSHAQMYAPLIRKIVAEQGQIGLLVPMNGCLPAVKANVSPGCAAMAQKNLDAILRLPSARTIVLGLTWDHEKNGLWDASAKRFFQPALPRLIEAVDDVIDTIEASGRSVILIGPIPYPGSDIASILSRERAFGWRTSVPLSITEKDFNDNYAAAFNHFENRLGRKFIRPDQVLCDGKDCHFLLNGHSLFA